MRPPSDARPIDRAGDRPRGLGPWSIALLMISGIFVSIEPAPFDLLSVLFGTVALVFGALRFPSEVRLPAAALLFFVLANFVSLHEAPSLKTSAVFLAVTLYLVGLWVVVVGLVGRRPETMMNTIMWGYACGAFIASATGIIAYLGVQPLAEIMVPQGRLKGFFKDPNVYGAYIIPACVFAISRLTTGRGSPWRWLAVLVVCADAIFLSYSRGAWGSLLVAVVAFLGLHTFAEGLTRAWWRITVAFPLFLVVLAVIAYQLVNLDATEEMFAIRFGAQNYDVHRFGTQWRAVEHGLSTPLGIGPGASEETFTIAVHNCYIRAFVENGIVGALGLYAFMAVTLVRSTLTSVTAGHPLDRTNMAVVAAVLWAIYVESAVIDTIHWRHFWIFTALAWCPVRGRPQP